MTSRGCDPWRSAHGVADAVEFAGPVDDGALRAEYAACDLFALPSRREGFGLVYLEAMSLRQTLPRAPAPAARPR